MKDQDTRIIEGSITLELHGYLAGLKINLPEAEDIETGDYSLGKAMLEAGIPGSAVDKAIVNESLVSMAHKIKVGDKVVLFPYTV
ncbi:MAG: hypothetical protein Q4C00_03600 [Bacillota bacterium]|nr:hypothetical protein [Bacillota bacterium]